jgi:hypothetical protein
MEGVIMNKKFYFNPTTKDLIETDSEDFGSILISEGYQEKNSNDSSVTNQLKKEKNKYRIIELRNNLDATDYQIIKCYEAFMRQQTLPYNLEELSTQRDAWRAEINELEEELAQLE